MSAGPPLITYVLIGLNAAVFFVATFAFSGDWPTYLGLWPGATEADIAWYLNVGDEWYRWITAGFAHFGWLHLAMNMFALWSLGQTLEPALGRWRYLGLYAASLLGSSVAVMLLANSGVHAGASGAIFGLLAAYGIVLKRLRLPYTGVLVIAAIFIGGPLVSDLVPAIGFLSGLSWQGHLGGAVVGAVLMLAMLKGLDRREQARRANTP